MDPETQKDQRRHPRFNTKIPIRFNLNPDYHVVPAIRTIGVGGTARNISFEGILIYSRMDLLDLCQIFYEDTEDDSPLELEVFLTDPKDRMELIRGEVRWYRLSEPERDIRHFEAGIYLKDTDSKAVAKGVVEYTISHS